jgi:hypothetical protein
MLLPYKLAIYLTFLKCYKPFDTALHLAVKACIMKSRKIEVRIILKIKLYKMIGKAKYNSKRDSAIRPWTKRSSAIRCCRSMCKAVVKDV